AAPTAVPAAIPAAATAAGVVAISRTAADAFGLASVFAAGAALAVLVAQARVVGDAVEPGLHLAAHILGQHVDKLRRGHVEGLHEDRQHFLELLEVHVVEDRG